MASTVQAVLKQARCHNMQSIAIPLIGAGQAGWPPKLAAKIHIEQLLKFASTPGSVKVNSCWRCDCALHLHAVQATVLCKEMHLRADQGDVCASAPQEL